MQNRSLYTKTKTNGFLLIFFLLAACSKPGHENVAKVNQSNIFLQDYINRYSDFLATTHLKDNLQYRHMFIQSMIDEILLMEYAGEINFYDEPEHQIELAKIHNQLLLNYLYDRELADSLSPTEDELRTLYRWSKSRLHVQHLFARDLNSITKIEEDLVRGVPWDTLAKTTFKDPLLASNGGDLGFVQLGDMDPEFEKTAFRLSDSEISAPVQTEYGYSIIRVIEREIDPFLLESDYKQQLKSLTRIAKSYKKLPLVREFTDKMVTSLDLQFNEQGLQSLHDIWLAQSDPASEVPLQKSDQLCVTIGKTGAKLFVDDILFLLQKLSPSQKTQIQKPEDLKTGITGLIVRSEFIEKAKSMGLETHPEFVAEETVLKQNYIIKQIVDSIRKRFPEDDIIAQREGFISFRDSLKASANIQLDSTLLRTFVMEQPI